METREVKIKRRKRQTKNPYPSQEPVPVIRISGKWLIVKGYRTGRTVEIRSREQRLMLSLKEPEAQEPGSQESWTQESWTQEPKPEKQQYY